MRVGFEAAQVGLVVVLGVLRKVVFVTEATEDDSDMSTRGGKGSVVVFMNCVVLVVFTLVDLLLVCNLDSTVVDSLLAATVSKRGGKGSAVVSVLVA